MSKEFQIRDGNLIASFDLENEDGDIDFCKLLKVSHGVADEIGMFVDYVATNKIIKDQSKQISDLEAKLAESKKKPNQYPYKNEVIEKQYEELKDGIKFRIENNITDDWEQHYHCIDVLCEKHKARIRDIENGICVIEKLEKQLSDMEQEQIAEMKEHQEAMQVANQTITNLVEDNRASQEWYKKQLAEKDKLIEDYSAFFNQLFNQDKISFAVEQLEKVKELCREKFNWWENSEWEGDIYDKTDVSNAYFDIEANIDQQIQAIKEKK